MPQINELMAKWIAAIVVLSVISLSFYIQHVHVVTLETKNEDLQSQINEKQAYINTQNILITANKTEYETNLAKANAKKAKVIMRYKTIYANIDSFGKDKNATTCPDSINYLNNFSY